MKRLFHIPKKIANSNEIRKVDKLKNIKIIGKNTKNIEKKLHLNDRFLLKFNSEFLPSNSTTNQITYNKKN